MPETTNFTELRRDLRTIVREWGLMNAHPCVPELTLAQGHALIELEGKGAVTIADLARSLTLDHSTASRLVSKLVAMSYVRLQPGKTDARSRELALTRRGSEVLRKLHVESDARVKRSVGLLTAEEQAAVQHGLALYAKALKRARKQGDAELRKIRKKDNAAMAEIIRRVMPEFGANGPGFALHDAEVDSLFESYSGPGHGYFVIEVNGAIVGGGGYGPLKGGGKRTCELRKMYLLPTARGCGLGEALLRHCLEAAAASGYQHCYLETTSRMVQAQALYQKVGFEPLNGPRGATGHFGCDRWYAKNLRGELCQA